MTNPQVHSIENPWEDKGEEVKTSKKAAHKQDNQFFNQDPNSLDKGIKIILLILILVPLGAWLSTGFYTIQPDEEGVLIRFGKYSGKAQPGLRYKFPDPIDKVTKVSVTNINREVIGTKIQFNSGETSIPDESQMLTGDENIIELHFFIQWKIKDSYNYVFKIKDISPENSTLRLSAESAMREVMGLVKLNEAISEQRQDIEKQAKIILQKMLDDYQTGIEVVNLGILYSYVPAEVKDAYRDIQAAKADKEREINQAYAYRNDILPKARGEVFAISEKAKGKKEAIIAEARGQANKFNSIVKEYLIAPELTKKRLYLETMEEVLSDKEKLLVTQDMANSSLPILQLDKNK
jgi:membrane protease subunit HflK